MLSNAYFLAKFRFDTAENEPAKNLQNFRKMHFSKMHFSKKKVAGALSSGACRAAGGVHQGYGQGLGSAKLANFTNFANFQRARSRLYQNEILQENMRLTAFFKLYKISILLHRCNLKTLAKNRFEKSAIVVKIQQNFCKCCKILQNFAKIQKI